MEVNRASSGLPAEKGQHGGKKIGGEAAAAAAPCGGSAGKDGVLPLDFEGIHRERGQKKTRPSNGTGEKERNVWGLLILNPVRPLNCRCILISQTETKASGL